MKITVIIILILIAAFYLSTLGIILFKILLGLAVIGFVSLIVGIVYILTKTKNDVKK